MLLDSNWKAKISDKKILNISNGTLKCVVAKNKTSTFLCKAVIVKYRRGG